MKDELERRLFARLSINQFLQFLRIPFPVHRNLRRRLVDLPKIVGRKFDGSGSDIFFQPMQFRSSRDRHYPRLLRKQPGERDLCRCRLLSFCNLAQQINHRLICFPSLWSKTRDDIAEISAVELRILVDLARKEALSQRAEWNESDAEFLERRQHFLLRLT